MEETLRSLVEFVKTASPVVWDALLRQVQVDIAVNSIWLLVLLSATVLLVRVIYWGQHGRDKSDDYSRTDWLMAIIFSVLGACITFGIAIACFTAIVARLLNPNYYAIQMILQNLR